MACHREEHDGDHERKLSRDPENRLLVHSLVGVAPDVKSLQRPKRLVGKSAVNELERIGDHGRDRTEKNDRKGRRGAEQNAGEREPKESVRGNLDDVRHESPIQHEVGARSRRHADGAKRVVPMRNGIEQEVAGESERRGRHRV